MNESLPGQLRRDAMPFVTVAMPVYNAGHYLRLAVLSIVRQTYTNWELLIIDDGSTDNSIDSIADIQDKRIRILRDSANKGLAARLNEAVDLAQGQYFARMDQDDVSFPKRFESQVQALQNEDELDLVAVRAITISGNNKLTGILPYDMTQEEISARPWRGFYLPHPTWMGKVSWFRKYRYAAPGPYFCEDQELLLRSYERSRFLIITEPLFAYRIRDEINWRKLFKTRLTILQLQLRKFIPRWQLFFALMSISTFFGRTFLDIVKGFSSITYPIIKVRDEELSFKWQQILNYIEQEVN